jgi:hypothetical protein
LDDHHIAGAPDVQIVRIVNEMRLAVLGGDLEAILGGNGDGLDQRAIDRIADFATYDSGFPSRREIRTSAMSIGPHSPSRIRRERCWIQHLVLPKPASLGGFRSRV